MDRIEIDRLARALECEVSEVYEYCIHLGLDWNPMTDILTRADALRVVNSIIFDRLGESMKCTG